MGRRSRKGGVAQRSTVRALFPGVAKNVADRKADAAAVAAATQASMKNKDVTTGGPLSAVDYRAQELRDMPPAQPSSSGAPPDTSGYGAAAYVPGLVFGGRKTQKLGNTFNRCVKSVRSTVKARKGSTKESAAIAICTTSVLHPRGRTIKRYRKKRLITQRKFRGGTCA